MRWTALGVDYEMCGQGPDRLRAAVIEDLPRARRHAARGLQLRALPRREGQKISKSKGNGLTIEEWLTYASPGKPAAFHVPEAAQRQAAALRRHPARHRRVPTSICAPIRTRRRASGSQPRLAHPRGIRRPADMQVSFSLLLNLASAANGRGQGRAVGVPAPLCAAGDARDPSRPRRGLRPRRALLPGLREADQALPRAERARSARRWRISAPGSTRGGAGTTPRSCRRSSTRSAGARLRAAARLVPARSTRCCSARNRARASAASSRSTACPRRRADRPGAGRPARRLNARCQKDAPWPAGRCSGECAPGWERAPSVFSVGRGRAHGATLDHDLHPRRENRIAPEEGIGAAIAPRSSSSAWAKDSVSLSMVLIETSWRNQAAANRS